ncbi:MAG TPA: hypothetical protein VG890_13890 [Puia sp.]|nr:hypothetical protein [Puia sp.]
MKGQELKILFKEDMAFLTMEVALNFNQVQISDSPVKFKAPAFWTVRVINYVENEKRLYVEVLSYQVGETEFSYDQIQLAEKLIEIEKVTFKSIDTTGLLRTLNSTEPIKILPPKQESVYRPETPIRFETKLEREPIKQTYNEPFSISIKNITFFSGGVSFRKKIQQLKKEIEFQILNENIIEEYDAIKNYFASVLRTKQIQVVPNITTLDGIITSINATSTEIEKIDNTLIEEVKYEIVKSARSNELLEEKQLFTVHEYLDALTGEDTDANKIFKNDNEFFDILLERTETKHYKHLRFLSSKHKADIQKLRLVHAPFSFVFLLSSSDKFHIVWETLDTQEATYIWTVVADIKNLKKILTHIDKTISLILKDGKNEYIRLNEKNFNRVFHDYTDSQNGFKNWKGEIEKVIPPDY